MKDMQRMMKQAQKMAAEMQEKQAALAEENFEGSAGGGMVKAVVSGDLQLERVTIASDFFEGEPDGDDIEMLGDTVTAAVNDALTKARDAQAEMMGPMGGGLGDLGLGL